MKTELIGILENAKGRIADLERQLSASVLVGENYVVGFKQYGLFLNGSKQLGGVGGAVCYTREDAASICADDNIKNGSGEVAAPVPLRDAREFELQELKSLVTTIEAA